jgi:hypothetical protein
MARILWSGALLALSALLCCAVPACRELDSKPTAKQRAAEERPPAPQPPDAPPSPDAHEAEQSLKVISTGPTRELHPIGGGRDCMEMYSNCTKTNGQTTCGSASFMLACGESGALPSTGERLTCICP